MDHADFLLLSHKKSIFLYHYGLSDKPEVPWYAWVYYWKLISIRILNYFHSLYKRPKTQYNCCISIMTELFHNYFDALKYFIKKKIQNKNLVKIILLNIQTLCFRNFKQKIIKIQYIDLLQNITHFGKLLDLISQYTKKTQRKPLQSILSFLSCCNFMQKLRKGMCIDF